MGTMLLLAFSILLLNISGIHQVFGAGHKNSQVDLPIPVDIKLDKNGKPEVFETEDFVITLNDDSADAKLTAEETGFQYVSKILKNRHIFRRQNPVHLQLQGGDATFVGNPDNLQEHKTVKDVSKQEKEEIKYYTNDQGWPFMFYMNGETEIDMNISTAWSRGYTGKNVTIAIVDDGIDFGNTDLDNNMDLELSLNTLDMSNVPYPSDSDAHGTKCAGTAAAIKDNGVCGVGSAHEATLVGIKFFKSSEFVIDDARTALALTHRNDVIQIYSNSWGSGKFSAIGPLTANALETGIKEGRNGLGSIFLFSAGNDGPDDTCNHDERTSNIYVITISSVQSDGKPAPYGENCPAILASSYGGALVDGVQKYLIACGRGNSCKFFDGTSSATPLAAGIIALILQANPNLTWRDVQHIIVETAISEGLDAQWLTNGAGYKVSPRLGFGLMNADAMVTLALKWKGVPPMESCSIVQESPELEPLYTTVSSSFLMVQSCNGVMVDVNVLEKIQVRLSFTAETFGDVLLNLTSPLGTTSSLSVGHPVDQSQSGSPTQYYGHTFTSVHFWGEDPVGTWRLDASLKRSTASGKIRRWTLTLYGTHKTDYLTTEVQAGESTDTTKQHTATTSSQNTAEYFTTQARESTTTTPQFTTFKGASSTYVPSTVPATSTTSSKTKTSPTTRDDTTTIIATHKVTSPVSPEVTFPTSVTTTAKTNATKLSTASASTASVTNAETSTTPLYKNESSTHNTHSTTSDQSSTPTTAISETNSTKQTSETFASNPPVTSDKSSTHSKRTGTPADAHSSSVVETSSTVVSTSNTSIEEKTSQSVAASQMTEGYNTTPTHTHTASTQSLTSTTNSEMSTATEPVTKLVTTSDTKTNELTSQSAASKQTTNGYSTSATDNETASTRSMTTTPNSDTSSTSEPVTKFVTTSDTNTNEWTSQNVASEQTTKGYSTSATRQRSTSTATRSEMNSSDEDEFVTTSNTKTNAKTSQGTTGTLGTSTAGNSETSTTPGPSTDISSTDIHETTHATSGTTQESDDSRDDNQWYIPTIGVIVFVVVIGSTVSVMICVMKSPFKVKVNPSHSAHHKDIRGNKHHGSKNGHQHQDNAECRHPTSARSPADIYLHDPPAHGHHHHVSLNF